MSSPTLFAPCRFSGKGVVLARRSFTSEDSEDSEYLNPVCKFDVKFLPGFFK